MLLPQLIGGNYEPNRSISGILNVGLRLIACMHLRQTVSSETNPIVSRIMVGTQFTSRYNYRSKGQAIIIFVGGSDNMHICDHARELCTNRVSLI